MILDEKITCTLCFERYYPYDTDQDGAYDSCDPCSKKEQTLERIVTTGKKIGINFFY